jgi:transcriptional regulator
MYLPPHFEEQDVAVLHNAIRGAGLATLVTAGMDGPIASHIPLVLEPAPEPYGRLVGHVSRANPHWRAADRTGQSLAIFLGPDAYVSPSLYAAKHRTGKVVPTWNYVAIHAYGRLRTFDQPHRLLEVVTQLTERQESGRSQPWAVSDAPPEFIASQLQGIVGVELTIERLEGKWKMSQNRPAEDWPGIVHGLKMEGETEAARLVAERNRLRLPGT